jgi:hypothetical protein
MPNQWLWIIGCYAEPNHWFRIAPHDTQTLAQNNTPWFITTCSALHTMILNHLLSITHHDSQPLARDSSPWLKTTCSALHTQASGCESWCVKLSQRLLMFVCYAEPVVVNHCELWYLTMIHNHYPSMLIYDSQPLPQHNKPWLTITGSS